MTYKYNPHKDLICENKNADSCRYGETRLHSYADTCEQFHDKDLIREIFGCY